MARLVRAIHDLSVWLFAAASPLISLQHPAIMGRPDKPGDDGGKND